MAPKEKNGQAGGTKTRSMGDVAKGDKKKAVSRNEKAGLTLSVSKIHNHLLKHKKAKGVSRVSVSAPVWLTAAVEFFANELIEQAGMVTTDPKQQGGARKRISMDDLIKALRGDAELNRAMSGFRVLAGDKIKGKKINEELMTREDKEAAETRRATAAAARAEAAK
jgi:hypothetical protein